MKVLHLHAGHIYGGVETFLATLAREAALCPAMQPQFGLCFETRLTDELRAAGAPVAMLGEVRFKNPLSIFRCRASLRRLIEAERPDVAVCHMTKPFWIFGPVVRRFAVPTVLYVHGPVAAPLTLYDRMTRKGPPPNLVIGVSRHTVDTVTDFIFAGIPTGTIAYPMPFSESHYDLVPDERTALRAELSTGENEVVILQAARMNAWKGQKNLLKALALLRDVPNWVHYLAGGPQSPAETAYANSLPRLARELGIGDRIRFLGQRTDVARLQGASDIYCQANTESEGFSLSFTEAFSAGLPVVTTDLGSASEMITPECGLLVPPGDAPALAAALERLIRDAPLRRSMGDAARRRIRRLSDPAQQFGRLHEELTRTIALAARGS